MLVELHNNLTLRYFPRRLPLERWFERQTHVQVDSREVPALSLEDELVLICVHGAKHLWERLMWIADVAALVSRQSKLDWERAAFSAKEVGAGRMLHVGLLLAMNMTGAKLPPKVIDELSSDAPAGRIAAQIARRLPLADAEPFGLLGRAVFRIRMRGGFPPGIAYLLRLSLSPTEEDWRAGTEEKRAGMLDVISRPFRLARKYGRNAK